MQTYTHLLLAAALRKPLARLGKRVAALPPFRLSALLLGSILPDLPLILTTVVCLAIDRSRGLPMPSPEAPTAGSVTMQLFNEWFFENPWVIAEHNLFHSPLMVVALAAVAWWLWRRSYSLAGWFFWLLLSCLIHTSFDIPVHHDDGPLLLFPLNWELRYISPISYWDAAHHARPFAIIEHIVDLFLLVFALRAFVQWWRGRGAGTALD